MTSAVCAGVDGCRAGWVVATRRSVSVVDAIAAAIDHGYRVLAIDMPIGLPATAARRSEVQARRYLSPRGSTIFPTPVRGCLAATDYADACEISLAARGVRISKQSWHILPKIAELDRAVTADDAGRVIEAHPECSFLAMNGERPLASKHTATGIAQRMRLVHGEFGAQPSFVAGTRLDDVLDAYAMLWTAERFAAGDHETFPSDSVEYDARGLPMRIVR